MKHWLVAFSGISARGNFVSSIVHDAEQFTLVEMNRVREVARKLYSEVDPKMVIRVLSFQEIKDA